MPATISISKPRMPSRVTHKGMHGLGGDLPSSFIKRTDSIVRYGDLLAGRSRFLQPLHVKDASGRRQLIRYRWSGSPSWHPFRVGIFAGIHGDEQSGVIAVMQLLQELERNPRIAEYYELFIYPVCNPWGFDEVRRESSSGKDLNRCFWQSEEEPEVRALEEDLRSINFDGIISLHTDDTSEGIYGYANGSTLTRHLLEPALRSASKVLPRDLRLHIDTHPASESIIHGGYQGVLSAPKEQSPQPFQIVFETPHLAPITSQVEAHLIVLREILAHYRKISSEGRDI